ncbi:flagellar basal body P-ring formation protein FlgA [Rhodobacter capsulatus]|uniref:Flagella basal body P-ring formation protein FlgA n=1 Tax=Rhodobacter capsulatus TaxID=1061 RepID=A0A4V5PQC5_RHOCA|nr:flagellar basal body P-ring formation chaperone FlgA [Rhodobacter capsulatus]TKD26112.1 flagellar basal body P-ring formation protein FlgA [Rhodobacter capsulatus]
MIRLTLALVLATLPALAEAGSVVAARTLRAQTVITESDLAISEDTVPGALTDPLAAVGLETRTAIYPQQPISAADLVAPAVIERNQMVPLAYRDGSLSILTEGRALDRGAVGDTIRVMNITSKATLFAQLGADGVAYVQPH